MYLFSIWDGIATISFFGMDFGRGAKQFVFLFGGDGHLPIFYLGRDGHSCILPFERGWPLISFNWEGMATFLCGEG